MTRPLPKTENPKPRPASPRRAEPSPPLQGDRAYARLVALLDADGTTRGNRLPGELEMARRFGISRPVLRQALARLRAEGRIYSRKGSGNFVGIQPGPALTITYGPLTQMHDIQSLFEFRQNIEVDAAGRAAGHRDRDALHRIAACRQAMEAAVAAGQPAIEEDIAFHVAIARASGNRFHLQTLEALTEPFRLAVRLRRQLSGGPGDKRLAAVCREHAAIAAAIVAGRVEDARAAMAAHLDNGIQRLFVRP